MKAVEHLRDYSTYAGRILESFFQQVFAKAHTRLAEDESFSNARPSACQNWDVSLKVIPSRQYKYFEHYKINRKSGEIQR